MLLASGYPPLNVVLPGQYVCCAGLKLGGVGFQGEDSLDREFLIYLPVFSVLSS